MNPHLDELISIVNHPAIQGRRGEWKVGDCCYDPHTQSVGYYVGNYTYMGGMTHTIAYEHCLVYAESMDRYIWLPPLSDHIQPERGSLSMLKGINDFYPRTGQWVIITNRAFYGPTPEIAVCRAIIAQEEQ